MPTPAARLGKPSASFAMVEVTLLDVDPFVFCNAKSLPPFAKICSLNGVSFPTLGNGKSRFTDRKSVV